MAVASPTSLANIVTEFGEGIFSSNTFTSGSGTITAPSVSNIVGVRIKVWGGGGGGWSNLDAVFGGGAGGGFTVKTVSVTPGVTQFSYSIGAGGTEGGDGATSTVTSSSPSVSLTATGGGGYLGSGSTAEGSGSGGDIDYSGFDAVGTDGGAAGGSGTGDQTDYGGAGYNGGAPGAGGYGNDDGYDQGGSGQVVFEWLFKGLSSYYRTGGLVPSHSANLNIPTSTTNLAISQFSGAELNFSATVTVGDNGGGVTGQYGYRSGLFGSINRDKVGLNVLNTSQGTIVDLYEFGVFNGLFTNYYLILQFNTNVTYNTLGYYFFNSITVNGTTFSRQFAATNQNGVYSGGVTTWDWISGVSRLLPTSGTYPVSIAFNFSGR